MDGFVGFIVFIVAVPITFFYFVLLNKIFDIYYLGCSGMGPVIFGCFFAAYITATLLVGVGLWLLILAAIAIVGYIIYAAATGQLKSAAPESTPDEGDASQPDSTTEQSPETTSAEAAEAPETPAADITPQPTE